MKVLFRSDNPSVAIPTYQTVGAAGADVCSVEKVEILPGEVKAVSTGIYLAIPEGYEIQIRPRSGLALKNKITVLNSPGTIDSDFRGELKVILINFSKEVFSIEPGFRIAQMVLNKVERIEFEQVESLPDTKRGSGGFGSTGVS